MSLTVEVFSEAGALLGTQDVWVEESAVWFEELSEFGGGQIMVPTDQAGLLRGRRLVRFTPDGKTPFIWQLQQPRQQRISTTDEALLAVWRGQGALAVLGSGAWGGAVNPDRRTFGWIEADADETGTESPTVRGADFQFLPADAAWPLLPNRADWIGSAFNSGHGTWARRYLDVATPGYQGPTRWWATAASPWRLWIDAEEQASGPPFVVGQFDFTLGDGHQLAFESLEGPILLIVVQLVDGDVGSRLYSSAMPEGVPEDWKVWQNGAQPPAITYGRVMGELLDAAQDRGAIPGVSWTFDADLDSAGQPWQVGLRLWTVRANELLGDVALSAAEAFGGVDAQMLASPLLELAAYDPAGSDLTATVRLTDDLDSDDPENVSVINASVISPPVAGTAVRLATHGSAGWVEDSALLAEWGRIELPMSVGTAETLEEVEAAGHAVLDKLTPLEVQEITIWDRPGATFGADFDLGDTIEVRHSSGTYEPFRVIRAGQSLEPGGEYLVDLIVREVRVVA